jgi:hypothetical protein
MNDWQKHRFAKRIVETMFNTVNGTAQSHRCGTVTSAACRMLHVVCCMAYVAGCVPNGLCCIIYAACCMLTVGMLT